jgi:hypothetical protein
VFASEEFERARPRARVNKAAWRAISVACLVVAVALLGALVAQTSLWHSSRGAKIDPLTTLALVLAILAFLVQIFVYIFQTNASNSALLRSEEVNADTRRLLTQIQASSQATQRVLFTQFDRLLDYVVGGSVKPPPPRAPSEDGSMQDDGAEDADEDDGPELGSRSATLTREDLDAALEQWVRTIAPPRPTFEPTPVRRNTSPSAEDRQLIAYLRGWPSREEAMESVGTLEALSPLAVAGLKRVVDRELAQRHNGEKVGLRLRADDVPREVEELERAGLVTRVDGSVRLTDHGRRVARVIVTGKPRPQPPWADAVLLPLLQPRGQGEQT